MIRTKQDLKEYIEADLSVQPAPNPGSKDITGSRFV